MHRRARHFKPKSVGASLGFDSRFIFGLSNGSSISTWSDLSGNANDATQATSGNQPTYQTEISGGSPGVKFNGSTTSLACGSFVSVTEFSLITAINIVTANSTPRSIFYQGNYSVYTPLYNWIGLSAGTGSATKYSFGNYNNPNDGSITSSATFLTGNQLVGGCVNDSGTNRLFINGSQDSTSTSQTINLSTSSRPSFGKIGPTNNDFYDGYILSVLLTPSVLSAPLRRRIDQAYGFSFKIACS